MRAYVGEDSGSDMRKARRASDREQLRPRPPALVALLRHKRPGPIRRLQEVLAEQRLAGC